MTGDKNDPFLSYKSNLAGGPQISGMFNKLTHCYDKSIVYTRS